MRHRPTPLRLLALLAFTVLLPACDDDATGVPEATFLDGTDDDPQIGLVVNTLSRTFDMFQLGDPSSRREVALGASNAVSPVGLSVRGTRAAVPLGNAASVAVIDLESESVERFFLFSSGNATGSAWIDDRTVVAANLLGDYVGRFDLDQSGDAIGDSVAVTPAPSDVVFDGSRVLVVSGNLDDAFQPLGESVVTALDPTTMAVLDTVSTGGTNATAAALGPDGLLYVLNTGDFVAQGSMAVIDPATMQRIRVVDGMGAGPGSISADARGLVYVSGFSFGTLVWDSGAGGFLRGPGDPVCAALAGGGCRGAFDAVADDDGDLYQVFFGSQDQTPRVFVYEAGDFTLADSVETGSGPVAIDVRTF